MSTNSFECKTCGGNEMILLREHVTDCDRRGRDGGDCVLCKGTGHYFVGEMTECPECSPPTPTQVERL